MRSIQYRNILPEYTIDQNKVIYYKNIPIAQHSDGYVRTRTTTDSILRCSPNTLYNYTYTDKLLLRYDGIILDKYPDYIVCRDSQIFSLWANKFLLPTKQYRNTKTKEKYDTKVRLLDKDGVSKDVLIHRLIATAFIPNPENKPEVNHIDGDPSNNAISNLEWCTHQENMTHAANERLFTGRYRRCSKSSIVYELEEIARFSSLKEAVDKKYATTSTNLQTCCKKNISYQEGLPATHNGYVFKYVEDTDTKHEVKQEQPVYTTSISDIEHKPIEGYSKYLITVDGRILDAKRSRWLKISTAVDKKSKNVYSMVSLKENNGKYKSYRLATLMAKEWLGYEYTPGTTVGYKDGNRLNVSIDNLVIKPPKGGNEREVVVYKLLGKETVEETFDLVSVVNASLISACCIANEKVPINDGTDYYKPFTHANYIYRFIN